MADEFKGLLDTLNAMESDSEMREVCDMNDEYLKSIQERALNRQEPNKDATAPSDGRIHNDMIVHGSLTGRLDPQPPKGVLNIEVLHKDPRSKFEFTANYVGDEIDWGEGSTPYMALLDLINNYNPTVKCDDLTKRRAQAAAR